MCAFKIRAAKIEDADHIAYVRITGWRQSYRGMMPDSLLARLDIASDALRVRQHLADDASQSLRYVVEQDGGITGMAACGPARGDNAMNSGEVYAIYLLDSAKRQGIGEALMRHMAAALHEKRLTSLQVCVLRDNAPARKFYEKLGGRPAHEGVFTFDGHDLPDVTYIWPDITALLTQKF